ncbi:hypothetical protein Tco_0599951 [Tanacetum coccineum]
MKTDLGTEDPSIRGQVKNRQGLIFRYLGVDVIVLAIGEAHICYYRRFIANSSKVAKPLASLKQKIRNLLRRIESRIRLCTHAKRQGRERDNRNVVWPGPTNEKEGRWRVVREDFKMGNLARLYTNEIVTRHGVHVSIISDVIIRVFDVLYLKRCMEGNVGHTFFRMKLEKFGRLDRNWYKRQQIRVEVGDKVMLEVSSWKDVVHFGKKGKLAPRYVGPFEILERIGPVAYRLRLPKELSEVHDTFHVSNLKKCLADANLHVPLEEIKVDKTLYFVKEPVEIIDRELKSLKRSRVPIVKSIRTRSEVMRIS